MVSLFGKSRIELMGQKATAYNNGYVESFGDVWLRDKFYTVFGDYVRFDKKNGDVNLSGNIYFFEKDFRVIKSDKANFNIKTRIGNFTNSFLFEKKDNIWLKSEVLDLKKDKLTIYNGSFSSCDAKNPDWKITFSKGKYDNSHSFVEIENALLYANGIPIFYLPYYQFATKRKTGLLTPSVGVIENQGFFYSQPIYYAPEIDWDLEFSPQIRTQRGAGLFTKYRFADSPNSKGEVGVGVFGEKRKYVKKFGLINKNHFGAEIKYEKGRIFSKGNHKDELFVDFTTFNDAQYLNTKSSKINSDKMVESELNYYYDSEDNYYGFYAKYFLDTTKISNEKTMQKFPLLHYHRFSNSVLENNLIYSVDIKTKNLYQEVGLGATQLELAMPLTIHFNLLDDYLNFSLSQNLYSTFIEYSQSDTHIQTGKFFSNFLVASLNTDLSKKYDDFFHTINIGLYYTHPQHSRKRGYFADFIQTSSEKNSLDLKFSQYFYNKDGLNFFSQTLSQPYYLKNEEHKRGILENDIEIKTTKNLTISNQIDYSHFSKRLSKIESAINYKQKYFDLKLAHTYQEDNVSDPNYLTAEFQTKLNSRYNFFIKADYNSKYDIFKLFKIGYKMKKKCWDYALTYEEETMPTLSDDGEKSFVKKGIFLRIELYPIGETKFRHQREKFIDD